jgi:Fe-S-cluster containining protein
MKYLEYDIEKIKQIAQLNESENYEFRAYLKGLDSKKVDKIVHQLHAKIISEIDCTQCGNCCNSLTLLLTEEEIKYLSDLENIDLNEFVKKYVEIETIENVKYFKNKPCKYLKNKKCTIYQNRPNDCKSYPHTHKISFTSRTLEVIENYEICPIVLNLYESLKEELEFHKM